MATDVFKNDPPSRISPAVYMLAVTPDDNNDMTYIARGFWVGRGGNLNLVTTSGSTVLLENVSGFVPGGCIARVKATGTTAGAIVAYI